MNNINYPIFIYNKKWAWKLTKKSSKKEATDKYCQYLYKEIKIVDSHLNFFIINDIEILKKAGFFGYKFGYKGLYFHIKENYKFVKKLQFVEFKKIIIDLINSNNEIYNSGLVIENLIKDIENSKSFIEIMNLLPCSD